MSAPTLPQPGQRVGRVCGPGQWPEDNAGTALCHVTNEWGTHALVMMDSGEVLRCESLNRRPGIGWHAITPQRRLA